MFPWKQQGLDQNKLNRIFSFLGIEEPQPDLYIREIVPMFYDYESFMDEKIREQTFRLGVDDERIDKKSGKPNVLHQFFGAVEGKPNHPLGDDKVIKNIISGFSEFSPTNRRCTLVLSERALPQGGGNSRYYYAASMIQSNEALLRVRVHDRNNLFYVNVAKKICEEIKLTPEQLQTIDDEMKPSPTAKVLKEKQLARIASITGYAALNPKNNATQPSDSILKEVKSLKPR